MRIGEIFEQDDKKVLKLSGNKKTVPMSGSDTPEPIRIKLGSKHATTAAQRFMDEFNNSTQEHPFTRGMRYFTDGPVLVKMGVSDEFEDEVELMDIQSKARGAGARALETICRIADAHDVTIDLYAMGYAHVPTEKLVEYYTRFGFEVRNPGDYAEDGISMIRHPR